MAIQTQHVVMGKHILASGSLAGEMKVQAISGSTGLTLNQMLVKLSDVAVIDRALLRSQYIAADAAIVGDAAGSYDTLGKIEDVVIANDAALRGDAASAYNTLGKIEDVIIANDAALRGDSASAYNTLGKVEDFIIALTADVAQNEADSDSAESTLTTNLSNLSGGLDGRLDVLEAGVGSAGSVAKAQADAQAFATSAINDLIDSAPGALNTLNELAAAMGDDANFSTTVTNLVAANEVHVDNMATLTGVAKDAVNLGAFSGAVIDDNQTVKAALQALETRVEGVQTDVDGNESDSDAAIAANEVHIDNFATLSGVAKDSAHLGAFSGGTIADNQTLKVALQSLETKAEAVQSDVDANEAAEKTRLDHSGGFHVQSTGTSWEMSWGVNKPRISFEINPDASVTMSVAKEVA